MTKATMLMKNKPVLISGATSGIGKATVFELLENGFFVSGFAPDSKKCKALAKELARSFKSGQFLITPGDVTKESSLKKVIRSTINKFKNIDIVVNNAGVWIEGKLEKNNLEQIEKVLSINTFGVVRLTKLVLPYIKKSKTGTIVNISSQAGIYATKERSPYNASKWAITGFTKALQEELEAEGIKVIGIYPGKINTDLFKSSGFKKSMENALPPQAVAKLISFALNSGEHVYYPELGIKYI